MNILLTGSDGFVSGNLLEALIDQHEITVIEQDFWNLFTWPQRLDEMVSNSDIVLHIC